MESCDSVAATIIKKLGFSAMKSALNLVFFVLSLTACVWLIFSINRNWFIFPAIAMMAGSAIWFLMALISGKIIWTKVVKAWWRIFWDGFWGLG
jgi:hypothetical protein